MMRTSNGNRNRKHPIVSTQTPVQKTFQERSDASKDPSQQVVPQNSSLPPRQPVTEVKPVAFKYVPSTSIFERLHTTNNNRTKFALREAEAEIQFKEACPFRQNITNKANQRQSNPRNRAQELFDDAKKRQARLEAQRPRTDFDAQECTFHPSINTDIIDHLEYVPIDLRTSSILVEREIRKNRLDLEVQNECTFHPVISETTDSLLVGKDRRGQIGERLFSQSIVAAERQNETRAELDAERWKECSFKPSISRISEMLVEESSFQTRQNEAAKRKEERLRTPPRDKECTFQPKLISGNFRPLSATLPSRKGSDDLSRHSQDKTLVNPDPVPHLTTTSSPPNISRNSCASFVFEGSENDLTTNRSIPNSFDSSPRKSNFHVASQSQMKLWESLREGDLLRKSDTSTSRFEPHRTNATPRRPTSTRPGSANRWSVDGRGEERQAFTPQINGLSRLLAVRKSVSELSEGTEVKMAREEAKRREEEKERRECTHRPVIHRNPLRREGKEGEIRERRREEMEEWKRQREEAELRECTFQPAVNSTRPQSPQVRVKGLGRYLENVERALRMKEEQAKREKEVMCVVDAREIERVERRGVRGGVGEAKERTAPIVRSVSASAKGRRESGGREGGERREKKEEGRVRSVLEREEEEKKRKERTEEDLRRARERGAKKRKDTESKVMERSGSGVRRGRGCVGKGEIVRAVLSETMALATERGDED